MYLKLRWQKQYIPFRKTFICERHHHVLVFLWITIMFLKINISLSYIPYSFIHTWEAPRILLFIEKLWKKFQSHNTQKMINPENNTTTHEKISYKSLTKLEVYKLFYYLTINYFIDISHHSTYHILHIVYGKPINISRQKLT